MKKLIATVLSLIMVLALGFSVGCVNQPDNNKDTDKNPPETTQPDDNLQDETEGQFYTLQEAYSMGYLTHENLQTIADLVNSIETIDVNTIKPEDLNSIKKLYASQREGEQDEVIVEFYGYYNTCCAVILCMDGDDVSAVVGDVTIDGIVFHYPYADLQVEIFCRNVNLSDVKLYAIKELMSYIKCLTDENYYSNTSYDEIIFYLNEGISKIDKAADKTEINSVIADTKDKLRSVEPIEIEGQFYKLREAYDKGYIDKEDIKIIYGSDTHFEVDSISRKVQESIKYSYLQILKAEVDSNGQLRYPNATIDDIRIKEYCGNYNGVYVVKITDKFSLYPDGITEIDFEGTKIYYDYLPCFVWRINN